jgi:dipeptidyl aminopeptidase/acylaminoacyl peptidase
MDAMRTPQPTVANDGLTAAARGRAISAIAILVFSLSLASVGQAQRRIAYASDRGGNTDVRIMKASGAGDRRMTTHPAEDRDPTWAPNGRQIAFASDRDGVPQIYVIDLDGTGLRRLTDIPRGAHEPDWHPSGSRLLYSEGRGYRRRHLHGRRRVGSRAKHQPYSVTTQPVPCGPV